MNLSRIKRILILQLGLLLFGLGMALIINSHLGVDPWTVFHIGAAKRFNISIGILMQVTGFLFLLLSWALLQQRVGIDLATDRLGKAAFQQVRRTAGNAGAAFSSSGYSALIKRAGKDGVLTLTVGQRDDLSGDQLKELLSGSIDVVRRRLLDVAKPRRQAAIRQAMTDISGLMVPVEGRRNFEPAQRAVLALHAAGNLNESALLDFAKAYKYEESIAALSGMSGVKIATLDRLISGDRYDPILIVSKVIGLEWATVRALILLRLGPNRVASPADLEGARVNFARLMPSTAERVVTFWKTRQTA